MAFTCALDRRDGVRRAQLALRHLGEHLRDQEGREDLVHRGIHRPGVADVVRVLLGDRRQDRVLPFRLVRVGLQRPCGSPGRKRTGEAREVVELRRDRRSLVRLMQEIDEELVRVRLILRELPDRLTTHQVLEAETSVRPGRDRPDPEVVRERQVLRLRRPRRRDRVQDHRRRARSRGSCCSTRGSSRRSPSPRRSCRGRP